MFLRYAGTNYGRPTEFKPLEFAVVILLLTIYIWYIYKKSIVEDIRTQIELLIKEDVNKISEITLTGFNKEFKAKFENLSMVDKFLTKTKKKFDDGYTKTHSFEFKIKKEEELIVIKPYKKKPL